MRSFIGGFLIVAIILLASMSCEVMDKHEKLGEARGYRNGWNECEEQYAVDHGPDNWTPPPDSITVREAIAMARVEASAELDTCICLETASIMLLAAEVGRRGIKRWGCWDNRGVKTWWYPPTTGGTPRYYELEVIAKGGLDGDVGSLSYTVNYISTDLNEDGKASYTVWFPMFVRVSWARVRAWNDDGAGPWTEYSPAYEIAHDGSVTEIVLEESP